MPFNRKPQKFNASIKEVTIGCGEKAVTLGGENVYPFYSFDGEITNAPKVAVEISDMGVPEVAGLKAYYEGCSTMAEIAKRASEMEGADFARPFDGNKALWRIEKIFGRSQSKGADVAVTPNGSQRSADAEGLC